MFIGISHFPDKVRNNSYVVFYVENSNNVEINEGKKKLK